jgi:serine/threonine protein kinase/Tol biopolymer transport system component
MSNCPNCGKEYNPGDEVCSDCGLVFPFTTDVLTPGTVLQGRYEIQELSHTGGMGYIYLAKDKKLYERLCIVKQVKEPVKSDADLKKLEEEAKRMAKLSHPNVAMILDHFVEDSHYFLVVERIAGKTLSEVFEEHHGRLNEEEVIGWAISMCDVVAYIHKQGIIHRDISPDNVMLTEEGNIKFVDFGTLRELRYITTSGTAGMGKYGYTPPEQWQGKPVPQSDIFALGATVYYLLTGNLPLSKEYLSGQGPQKTDFSPEFPPIRTKNSDISPELEAVLQKALQLDVSNRYSTATEFGQELRNLATVSIPKREPSERSRPILNIDTDHIKFINVKAGSHATRTLTIRNLGAGRLTGRITTSHPWLKVVPMIVDTERFKQDLLVTVDTTNFDESMSANGNINIDTNGGAANIDVSLSPAATVAKPEKEAVPKRTGRKKLFLFAAIGCAALAILVPLGMMISKNMSSKSAHSSTETPKPSVGQARPAFPGTTSSTAKIVYQAGGDIWIVDADGNNQMKLAHFDGSASDFHLAVSPDGNKIAASPYPKLIVMNIDGSDSRTLADRALGPSWSPDGTNIVFDNGGEICVVNINSGEEREITHWGSGYVLGDRQPSWSPDGKRIAFARMDDKFNEICVVNADGSNVKSVYSEGNSSGDEWIIQLGPFWSPDGTKIIFGFKREDHTEIRIVNADGSECRRLAMLDDAESLDWSPDSKKIAFGKEGHICTINADGTYFKDFTEPYADYYYPKWSPDGKKIAILGWVYSFATYSSTSGIYTMNCDGTDRNLVVSTGVDITSNPIWAPR